MPQPVIVSLPWLLYRRFTKDELEKIRDAMQRYYGRPLKIKEASK